MDLIIIDENITYAKSLREYCVKSSNFKNVIIFRNLKELLDTYSPKKGIFLFEVNESNNFYIDRLTSNQDLTIVAFCKENINKKILANVSSAISQNDPPKKILEQLELIIDGKRILPKNIFDEIKLSEAENINTKNKTKFDKIVSKIFN
jgi:hypothetical protein